MEYLVGDTYGLIHLMSSIGALITGTLVLIMKKGTKRHKQFGYAYVISMAILLATSFMIYRLFKGWGIFHYATAFSLIVLLLGMIPIWTKKPANTWKYRHFNFMYWSVIGLYAAFAAEILTRIPETPFFGMVGIATGVITIIGAIFLRRNQAKWVKIFAIEK
jgi:uncharacterized membrane protein